MGTSALFFKPSEVHPCPGPELWERERETLNCEDKKSKMQRRKTKQRTEGLAHARVQRFSLCLFLDALIIFLGTGKHVPPRHTQAMINAAGPPGFQEPEPPPQKFQRTATATFFFSPPRWHNAGYESQAVKSEVQKVQTLRLDVKPGEDTDEMNACLTETWGSGSMRTHSGGGFLFFLFNPPVCLHR